MQIHLEEELNQLKEMLFRMSDLSLEAIADAVESLKSQDLSLSKKVTKNDKEIDQMEKDIDDLCLKIIVTQQPAASDLRFILSVMKINTDLERIADLASTIARQTKKLAGQILVKPLIDIPRMAEISAEMMKFALLAVSEKNTEKAVKVLEMDKMLDELDSQIYRELYSYMLENPSVIAQSLALIKASKSLERIGDHIKNIAERAVYYIQGDDIRHLSKSKFKALLDQEER
ncbi:MAG: phosphate signaling complex protein PhoU [Spirochaetes bacterium]|nr:phosphate signaling complex protein PhoU [Spirochaetota bacterium]